MCQRLLINWHSLVQVLLHFCPSFPFYKAEMKSFGSPAVCVRPQSRSSISSSVILIEQLRVWENSGAENLAKSLRPPRCSVRQRGDLSHSGATLETQTVAIWRQVTTWQYISLCPSSVARLLAHTCISGVSEFKSSQLGWGPFPAAAAAVTVTVFTTVRASCFICSMWPFT